MRDILFRKEVVMYLKKLDSLHLRIGRLYQLVEDVHFAVQRQTLCNLNGHVTFVRLYCALRRRNIVFEDTQVVMIHFNYFFVISTKMFSVGYI